MDPFIVQFRIVIPQTFFHAFTDSRKQPRTCEHSGFSRHLPRLPHLGKSHPSGVAGDLLVHALNLALCCSLDQNLLRVLSERAT
jgi:hypothetical protein